MVTEIRRVKKIFKKIKTFKAQQCLYGAKGSEMKHLYTGNYNSPQDVWETWDAMFIKQDRESSLKKLDAHTLKRK